MGTGRSQSVGALIVAAAALLFTAVFGFLSFIPGTDPDVAAFLELSFFGSGAIAMGAFITYVVMSRKTDSGETKSKFDRLLEQRSAALGAVPVGLVAVLIGFGWYMTKFLAEDGIWAGPAPDHPATQTFAAIDTAGIAAFLIMGSLYVIVSTYLAIRAERAAIRLARDQAEVS